ncbi:MAG: ABC transporter ATP-binding protein [Acidimicrobiales bacterium]
MTESVAPAEHRLRPGELAEAAVMADLAVLAVLLARLSPFAGLTAVVGAVPFVVLGIRHRTRAIVVAFVVAVVLVFLLAGFNAATQVLVMAVFGGLIGRGMQLGWSTRRLLTTAVGYGWVLVASLTVGFLWVFAGLRELNLDALRVQWKGVAKGLDAIGLDSVVSFVDPRIESMIDHWYLTVPVLQLAISVFVAGMIIRVGRPVAARVQRAFGERPSPPPSVDALAARLAPATGLTVITGPNGIGKSTLLRVIADRVGDRGRMGGTAIIGQRPESQVVGVRVGDDLVWGLEAPPNDDDCSRALELVGLGGFEHRETSSLSGGELQRLALASAALRRPALVLSDESTAMIDPHGRATVLAILRRLADDGATVIHVSHLDGDRAVGDRVIELGPAT